MIPSSGAGYTTQFTWTVLSPSGSGYLSKLFFLLGANTTGQNACYIKFDVASHTLALSNDPGNNWQTSLVPQQAGTSTNSQCTIDGSKSSFANNPLGQLAVTVDVTFKPAFAGSQGNYLEAYDQAGVDTTWTQVGTYTVPVDFTSSASPSSIAMTAPQPGTNGLDQTVTSSAITISASSNVQGVALPPLTYSVVSVPAGLTASISSAGILTVAANTSTPGGSYVVPVAVSQPGLTLILNFPVSITGALTLSCTISSSLVTRGTQVTWRALASGGTPPYGYSWSNTVIQTGTSNSVQYTPPANVDYTYIYFGYGERVSVTDAQNHIVSPSSFNNGNNCPDLFVHNATSFRFDPTSALFQPPTPLTVSAGRFIDVPFGVLPYSVYSGTVSFGTIGALVGTVWPTGISASFTPASWTLPNSGGGSPSLRISTSRFLTPGTYPLAITASDGSSSLNGSFSLVVTAPTGIYLNLPQPTISVAPGSSVSIPLNVVGTTGQTTFTVTSTLPTGSTATFTPTSLTGDGAGVMHISTTTKTKSAIIIVQAKDSTNSVSSASSLLLVTAQPNFNREYIYVGERLVAIDPKVP